MVGNDVKHNAMIDGTASGKRNVKSDVTNDVKTCVKNVVNICVGELLLIFQ